MNHPHWPLNLPDSTDTPSLQARAELTHSLIKFIHSSADCTRCLKTYTRYLRPAVCTRCLKPCTRCLKLAVCTVLKPALAVSGSLSALAVLNPALAVLSTNRLSNHQGSNTHTPLSTIALHSRSDTHSRLCRLS